MDRLRRCDQASLGVRRFDQLPLVAKSIIDGYVAATCPFWLAQFMRVTASVLSLFPWILTTVSVNGVSVVEPTMFVGFALLDLKM